MMRISVANSSAGWMHSAVESCVSTSRCFPHLPAAFMLVFRPAIGRDGDACLPGFGETKHPRSASSFAIRPFG